MTGRERCEQLLDVGRARFAEKGFEATSIEEIASRAGVSKPVVYEHFGGKEGLYAVVVDREMSALLDGITSSLTNNRSRVRVERVALALLTYVEERTDGFRIMIRDSPASISSGTYSSLLNDAVNQVASILALEGPQECVTEIRNIYQKRRDVLVEGLNKLGWHVPMPKATMFVWAQIPELYKHLRSLEFSKLLLTDAKVAVSPGIGFGDYGDSHVRFSLIENEERTRQALRGIKGMLAKSREFAGSAV